MYYYIINLGKYNIIIIIIIEYVTLNCNVHTESIPPHIRDMESGQNKAK